MAETSSVILSESSSDQEERLVSARSTQVLDNIGDKPNQPVTFNFPKRKFGQTKPAVFRSVQSAWFRKWPWLHYDQAEDKMFCHTCCQAIKQGNTKPLAEKKKDTFLTVGFTNWKDAAGDKKGAFPTHERSEVGINNQIKVVLFMP